MINEVLSIRVPEYIALHFAELLLFQNTVGTGKGQIMATNKKTMKVIANGIDEKEEPEIIMEGKVIAVDVPDELAEVFEGIIGSLISKSEKEAVPVSESEQDNRSNQDDDEWEPTETQELASDIAFEVAERTGEQFIRLMEGKDPEIVMGMLKSLERSVFRSDVCVLRALFLISEMKDAARDLDLLDICYEYDEAVYDMFHDYFFVSEGITDYCQQYYAGKEQKDNSPNSKLI